MKKIIDTILMGLLLPFLKGLILSVIFAFLLVLALLTSEVFGQSKPFTLKAGDTIPENLMSRQHLSIDLDPAAAAKKGKTDVPTKTIALSDFKDKLIILDFWGTWCSSCIAKFPALKKLQEKYKKDLAIILVNNEMLEKTHIFFYTRFNDERESFYNIISDTVITRLFPHRTVPHYVWIGKDGVVKSVSGANDINEENILTALGEQKLNIIQKIDLSSELPLFSSPYLPRQGLIKYSLLSKGEYSGYPCGGSKRMDSSGKTEIGVAYTNYPMSMIYSSLASKIMRARGLPFGRHLLIYEGKDIHGFNNDYYSYDFINPLEKAADLYPLMLEDLNHYGSYRADITSRKIKCLGLYRLEQHIDGFKKPGTSDFPVASAKTKEAKQPLNSMKSLNIMVSKLNYGKKLQRMVTNETGADDKLNLYMDIDRSLEEINSDLKKHGLVLRPFERDFQALVVRDK